MKRPIALIIDDEKDIRELIEMTLMGMGVDCVLSATVDSTIRKLKKQSFHFVITDVRLPDGSGMDIVAHIQRHYPELPVAIITAHGNMDIAVEALKLGAFDFINKPFDLMRLREVVKTALLLINNPITPSPKQTKRPSDSSKKTDSNINIIGESSAITRLNQIIQKLSRSQASIYIYGESGTGKELVAKNIHYQSIRKDGPFISVNCGAIPENLIESELFGYKKGAFTGASTNKDGLFLAANGGTLFLDEVADLPINMQVKLLRALQERMVRPVGSTQEEPFDARILSASHKRLTRMVEEKTFREDLFYRLNVISLGIPPLRKHKEDIPALVKHILHRFSKNTASILATIQPAAKKKLQEYDYPGNVRELENIIERALTFCDGNTITADNIQFPNQPDNEGDLSLDIDLLEDNEDIIHIPQQPIIDEHENDIYNLHIEIPNEIGDLSKYLDHIEEKIVKITLQKYHNDIQQSAKALGLTVSSLHYKLSKYNS